MITFISENIDFQLDNEKEVSLWLQRVAAEYGKKIGRLNYVFCSDEKILNVNNQYLNHDYFTDIITFDYSAQNIISGDIYISIDTVKSNTEKYNTLFINELHRVIVHGLLHLTGQNDQAETEQTEMTGKENEALGMLNGMTKQLLRM
ncbi:MAG: rRNA maturation RNase YbeY [Prevotellaceae bacterium]|jgi:rRNA maturation RNase YbeY|nr:rRNA maturation RNase YbeY [Prevotellaceae bacterium]